MPWSELKRIFRSVHNTFINSNQQATAKFIVAAIDHHKIDLSEYHLCGKPRNCFVHGNHKIFNIHPHVWEQADREYTYAWMKFTILHELAHVKQYNSGQLQNLPEAFAWVSEDQQITEMDWGEVQSLVITQNVIEYNKLPHELDANKFAYRSPLFTKMNLEQMLILRITGATK